MGRIPGLDPYPRNNSREANWSTVVTTTVGCRGDLAQESSRYIPPRS